MDVRAKKSGGRCMQKANESDINEKLDNDNIVRLIQTQRWFGCINRQERKSGLKNYYAMESSGKETQEKGELNSFEVLKAMENDGVE